MSEGRETDGVIDAHVHVVDVATVRPAAGLAPSGPWWERTDPSAAAVVGRIRDAGVERAVLVQAVGAHGYDCSYLLSAAQPGVALVGAVDPFAADPVSALDGLIEGGVAGLRLFSIRPPRPWLDGEVGQALVARCAAAGVRPSVCVLPDEIPALLALARAFPDVEFAVDHVAFSADDGDLASLAAQENLCPTVTPSCPVSLEVAIDRFGPHRLSWGSDHPQHGTSYPPPPTGADRLMAADRLWFA